MANMKNAKKKVKVIKKETVTNNNYVSSMKTAIKNVDKAVANKNKEAATANLKIAIKKIDKAKKGNSIKSNTVARNKSRLTKKVNEME